MITAGESSITHVALERPDPCVFTRVPGQLVRPRELPPAALPVADVGLLARVRAQVGLQVRRLRIDFTTARVQTPVRADFLLDRGLRTRYVVWRLRFLLFHLLVRFWWRVFHLLKGSLQGLRTARWLWSVGGVG